MSVNRHQPHVYVLPEDRANSQLANGFTLDLSMSIRQMQVLEEAGGWIKVLESFESDHIKDMDRYSERFLVLLIDFDRDPERRLMRVKASIPDRLTGRVFVLGTLSEPEELKADLGSYETIGKAIAKDCREGTDVTWRHELLQHNAGELDRMRERIRPILFPAAA